MRLLLDTCAFLWIISGSQRLPSEVRANVSDPNNEVYLSVVSAWEIAIKHATGRLALPTSPDNFVRTQRLKHGIDSLPLEEDAAVHTARLPMIHADPFDRALVSQALIHELTIVTPDEQIERYGVRTLW